MLLKTEKKALNEFEKLKAKKDQYKFVKEQVLIRYIGLGCSPLELLDHFVKTVIPWVNHKKGPGKGTSQSTTL